ncbi:uncharacterized protein LOC108040060 [Drosophila rhopaloa]|uniref:Uncharacterized protein LOC108040060 n=1 Tax=Drosophila rhopaloa TaxID=1041015 RepID=A0A6P4EHK6_DRORH|nr:uncharacterized protein LOC108040060 [Drosophila rhopaloa]
MLWVRLCGIHSFHSEPSTSSSRFAEETLLKMRPSSIFKSANSVVSNSNKSVGFTTSSSTHRERVSATTLSLPFRCSMLKWNPRSCSDHLAKRPDRSFMDMSHFKLAWSVMQENGIPLTYGRNFRMAISAARHSFSVTV